MSEFYKITFTIIYWYPLLFFCIFIIIRKKKNKLLVYSLISVWIALFPATNGSLFGYLYWDGPYYGRVLEARTGKPIEGASVCAVWTFDYIYIIAASSFKFGNAVETVTDSEGKFYIPWTWSISSWPLTRQNAIDLWVFKPGYDSYPPRIDYNTWEKDYKSIEGIDWKSYFATSLIACKKNNENIVKLYPIRSNKASDEIRFTALRMHIPKTKIDKVKIILEQVAEERARRKNNVYNK